MTHWLKERFKSFLASVTEDAFAWSIKHAWILIFPILSGVGLWVWNPLAGVIEETRDWMRADHCSPGYLQTTVPLVTFVMALAATKLRRNHRHQKYKCDYMNGVTWRWSWSYDEPDFNS